jgi:transcriptional regulator CtsR
MFSFLNIFRHNSKSALELRRAVLEEGYAVCSVCSQIIYPLTYYWAGRRGDYCNSCRPNGVVLSVTCEDRIGITDKASG